MEMENEELPRNINREEFMELANGRKFCWLCQRFEGDPNEVTSEWVRPCRCRGIRQWVHQACFHELIDELLDHVRNINNETYCPNCNIEFIMEYSYEVNYFVQILNTFDQAMDKLCSHLTQGIAWSTFYWSAVSYGAITVMQVFGEQEALTMMEDTNVYKLLCMLPTIPLFIILFKTINWEETLLLFVQRFTSKLPLLRTFIPSFLYEPNSIPSSLIKINSSIHPLKSLFLPTAAITVGKLLFYNSSYSVIKKTLLGGIAYTVVGGALRIYQREHNALRERTKKLAEYSDSNNEES